MKAKHPLYTAVFIYFRLEKYGILKAELERQGMRIDEFDLLTGVTALQKHFVMVTANVKHPGRLPHHTVEKLGIRYLK